MVSNSREEHVRQWFSPKAKVPASPFSFAKLQ